MLVWFSVTPIGTGSASVAQEVARAVEAVEATGVRATTDPSGTLLEGSWEECVAALRAAGEAVLTTAPRVSLTCKIDWRTDRPGQTGRDKLDSLRRHRRGGAEAVPADAGPARVDRGRAAPT
ncbi:hypothetical protein BH20ACT9_BH20ACT9_23960 [soil metagenome]